MYFNAGTAEQDCVSVFVQLLLSTPPAAGTIFDDNGSMQSPTLQQL